MTIKSGRAAWVLTDSLGCFWPDFGLVQDVMEILTKLQPILYLTETPLVFCFTCLILWCNRKAIARSHHGLKYKKAKVFVLYLFLE
uniref:Uncharacterized protein n=1 Tax=Catagonus wagneri TaxID=51154 RepID=A0A8C3WBP2_9CETA